MENDTTILHIANFLV